MQYSVFKNVLFANKLILVLLLSHRFVQYNPTSLERSYKYELQTEIDLGVPIDLINPETYKIDPNGK